MSAKTLRTITSIFVLCAMVMCVSGCSATKHVRLSENDIPLGVQELVKQCADPAVFQINNVEYYVFEPEDDGYFLIAFAEADLVRHTDHHDEFLVFGLVKESVDEEGNQVWTGDLCAGGGYTCSCEKGALSAVFSRDDFCAQAGCKYSAGWVKDSKVSKIEVISPQGETVTARMKNGFWWAGPYDWGRDFSKSRVVAYNKAGEVLHDVDLMSLWSL
jgi:hypothetical protein